MCSSLCLFCVVLSSSFALLLSCLFTCRAFSVKLFSREKEREKHEEEEEGEGEGVEVAD